MSYVPLIYGISATYLWVRFVLTMGKVARNYEVSATYIQPHSTIFAEKLLNLKIFWMLTGDVRCKELLLIRGRALPNVLSAFTDIDAALLLPFLP